MDKLKYIKLENPDGSYSDSIPLAVDSDHVSIGNNTLTYELNNKATKTELNSNVSNLQSEIESIASGSPAGVYTTVTALTTADPDHSKIYIVSENGHWYYYNNGWEDGGVYQAVVNDDKANDIETIAYNNFSVENSWSKTVTILEGAAFNTSTGAGTSNTKRARTETRRSTADIKMVILEGTDYLMRPFFHTSGTGSWTAYYQRSSQDWGTKFYLGYYPYFALSFKRVDDGTWTATDTTNLREQLHFYQFTDVDLINSNVPADAKAVGEKITILDAENSIVSSFSLSASDFTLGGYWGSNSGNWNTNAAGIYIGTTDKIWESNIRAISVSDDYKAEILYYDNANTYKGYSGDYRDGYFYLPNRAEYQGININIRKTDSTEITNEDLDDIAASIIFYEPANLIHTNVLGLKDSRDNNYKQSNPIITVSSDMYPSTTYHFSNYDYTTKMWRDGYLNATGSGITSSGFYMTTIYGLDYVAGSVPKAVKIKIKDTSVLSYPYIRLGWLDSPTNITIGFFRGEPEVTIPVPSYPNSENSNGALVCTVGRFKTAPSISSDMEARVNAWADANVEVSLIFEYIYNKKDAIQTLKGSSAANAFLYNSTLQYALKLPNTYKSFTEKKTPLVILCHGHSSTITASQWGSSTDMMLLVNTFVNAGYAVMDVQRVSTVDWCNPALIKKYRKAVDYILEHYNVEVKYIFGESMGSLIALTLQQFYDIRAIAISGVRLSLEERYAAWDDSSKAVLEANLGLTNGWDKNIVAMYDPALCELLDEDGERINYKIFPPTLYIQGTTDTTNYTESQLKIKAIQRGGNVAKISIYPGNHHTVCYLLAEGSGQEVLDWFNDYK